MIIFITVETTIIKIMISTRLPWRPSFDVFRVNSIDDFYYSHLDFDAHSPDVRRFVDILDKLEQLLEGQNRPKLSGHDAIHLILLLDSLWENYTRSWETLLPSALDSFRYEPVLAKKSRYEREPSEYWTQYGQWTTTRTDRAESITHRHAFYVEKMLVSLEPLQKKDPKRL